MAETGRRFPRRARCRHLLAHRQRAAAAVARSWPRASRGARSTSTISAAVPGATRRASARSARSTSTTCSSYWRALAVDEQVGRAASRRRSTTCSSTSTRTSTGCRSRSSRRCARERPRVTAVGDDFQAIYGFRSASAPAHPRIPGPLPRAARGHARAQLPLDAADPRHRQRGRGAGRARASRSGCAPSARAATRPELVFCRDEAAQARRGVRARARGARAGDAAARAGGADAHRPRLRPARARARAGAGSRSSSTAACATSRPRTSRTSSRCCAWPTTRPTSWPGSACCSCSRASARAPRTRMLDALDRRRPRAGSWPQRWVDARPSCPRRARERRRRR